MTYNPVNFLSSSMPVAASWRSPERGLQKNGLPADGAGKGPDDRDCRELRAACRQFESLFLSMMLREMRKTVPHDGILPQSNADDIYQSLFDSQLADVLAARESTGLTEFFYQQLA